VPPEFAADKAGYISLLVDRVLPYVARKGLAEFCDVFCEEGYFGLSDTERILTAARGEGLDLKLHADELTSLGGAELAVRLGARSADHLEKISERGIEAIAASDVVACVLPCVSFFLNHGYAPARRLIDAGAIVALASGFNPGSCMSLSMPLMMTIACTQMGFTPEEAITAATLHGAAALGMADTHGSIEVGKVADIVLTRMTDYRVLPYYFGTNHVQTVVKNGTILEF
jgi:imidazolonepropionase